MLPQFYKFVLVNSSGQTITYNNNGRVNLKVTCWYISTADGKITYAQLADDDMGFVAGSSIANTAELVGDTQIDNTSNRYMGAQVQLEITHDEGTAASGTFDLYVTGGDATGELQTNASGYDTVALNKMQLVGQLTWHASGVDDEMMRSPVWEI